MPDHREQGHDAGRFRAGASRAPVLAALVVPVALEVLRVELQAMRGRRLMAAVAGIPRQVALALGGDGSELRC